MKCLSLGIDITRDLIPVTPAAHYCCGGVKGRSQRRNLDPTALCPGRNLLHGAARRQPAGFELPDRSGRLCRPSRQTRHLPALLGRNPGGYSRLGFRRHPAHRRDADDHPVQTRDAGHHVQLRRIVRSNLSLERALRRLSIIYEETEELHNKIKPNRELCELRNMIAVAYLVIKQGSALKESVGCHYNSDYPKPDNK